MNKRPDTANIQALKEYKEDMMGNWIEETIPVVFEYGNAGESAELLVMSSHDSPNETIPGNYDYMFPVIDEETYTKYKEEYIQSIIIS